MIEAPKKVRLLNQPRTLELILQKEIILTNIAKYNCFEKKCLQDFQNFKGEFEKVSNPLMQDIKYFIIKTEILYKQNSAYQFVYDKKILEAEQYSEYKEKKFVLERRVCTTL